MYITKLYSRLGPKMGAFGKYTLPLTFSKFNTKDVVINTRKPKYSTIFDVSHMGIFETRNKQIIKDVFPVNLGRNKSKLTILTDNNGNVIDDLILGNVDNHKYRLVVNANTKDYYRSHDDLIEKKNKIILAIQGDHSQKLVETLFRVKLDNLYFMNNMTLYQEMIEICRCGYTGEDGFELYLEKGIGIDIIQYLIDLSCSDDKILFGGLIERDLLRLESGLCLSGTEFGSNMNINYKALGMDFVIDKEYRDKDYFKSDYKRVGFTNKKPIKKGPIINTNNEEVGIITSSNKSFNLNTFIGMGYLKKTAFNDNFHGDIKLANLPFIAPNYYKSK